MDISPIASYAKLCTLPKVHKSNLAFQAVVSNVDTAFKITHFLPQYLQSAHLEKGID